MIYFILIFVGFIIGFTIHVIRFKQHGFLIIEESKWIVDLHIPIEDVINKKFVILRVVNTASAINEIKETLQSF